jgi:prepilin-type N-terminal cleavage/methylation domain-containing protein
MRIRKAFTMIELIFVIVVIGIIAKFGVEFLIQAYNGYIFSAVQNKLQTQTETALEQITNRLQYRIKSSIIARLDDNGIVPGSYVALADANGSQTVLEWVGYDIDGLRGTWNGTTMNVPTWSGFIDLNNINTDASHLVSLETNTTAANNMINTLSDGAVGIAQSAIFFIGGNSDINKFGWVGGVGIGDQNSSMHPITSGGTVNQLLPNTGLNTFAGNDVYEYYQLAWTAYALVWNGQNNKQNAGYPSDLGSAAGTVFNNVLPNPLKSGTQNGQWNITGTPNQYVVKVNNVNVTFDYNSTTGSFTCNTADATTGQICTRLIK